MRYHKSLGFPTTLIIPDMMVNLGYTHHAKDRRKREGQYKVSLLPPQIKVCKDNIIEIHTNDNINIDKALIKYPYTNTKNLILVLKLFPNKKHATVITFWINRKTDNHDTVKTTLYDIPEYA